MKHLIVIVPASAGSTSPDREPSRLAARRTAPSCSENRNVPARWGPLRAGTARGPIHRLMQLCMPALLVCFTLNGQVPPAALVGLGIIAPTNGTVLDTSLRPTLAGSGPGSGPS
jgi:hypothetical protein